MPLTDYRARWSDHNPLRPPAPPVVCAIDVVGTAQARTVWTHLARTKDVRVKYQIFNGRIMSGAGGPSPWLSRPYSGPNPHRDHVHVSVGRGPDGRSTRPDLYDNGGPWGLATVEDDMKELVEAIQRSLAAAGHDPGPIDGLWGPKTEAAFVSALKPSGQFPDDRFRFLNESARHLLEEEAHNNSLRIMLRRHRETRGLVAELRRIFNV